MSCLQNFSAASYWPQGAAAIPCKPIEGQGNDEAGLPLLLEVVPGHLGLLDEVGAGHAGTPGSVEPAQQAENPLHLCRVRPHGCQAHGNVTEHLQHL